MYFLNDGLIITLSFTISFAACVAILATRRFHLTFSEGRRDISAIQAAHSTPTPRIGGIAVLVAFTLTSILSTATTSNGLWLLLPTLIPVAFAGFAEDLGFNVSPRRRLMAAMVSSALGIMLLDVWIPRADLMGLDFLLHFVPFAVALTIVGGAGICNAFNLIDGLNGLSSLVSIMAALALAFVAHETGETGIMHLSFVLIGAVLGFLVFNFPFGKIFLGDAGAYGIGHLLSWIAFLLLYKSPDVTPWALLLIFFWPLADTFLAIYRRRQAGRPTDQPDRLHFHQLVMRTLEISKLGRNTRHITNPLSTMIMVPMFTAPSVVGALLWNQPALAALALGLFTGLFLATYAVGMQVARSCRIKSGRRFLLDMARNFLLNGRKPLPSMRNH